MATIKELSDSTTVYALLKALPPTTAAKYERSFVVHPVKKDNRREPMFVIPVHGDSDTEDAAIFILVEFVPDYERFDFNALDEYGTFSNNEGTPDSIRISSRPETWWNPPEGCSLEELVGHLVEANMATEHEALSVAKEHHREMCQWAQGYGITTFDLYVTAVTPGGTVLATNSFGGHDIPDKDFSEKCAIDNMRDYAPDLIPDVLSEAIAEVQNRKEIYDNLHLALSGETT